MTDRPERTTPGELAAALAHVGYEVWMMAQAAARLATGCRDGIDENAYVESMLLHARALIDFFVITNDRPWPTDILRTQFTPEWDPEPADAAQRLRDHFQRLHRYLAHLTWDRVDDSAPEWEYWMIAHDVVAVADAWSKLLDPALSSAFRPRVAWALTTMASAPTFDRNAFEEPRPI